MSDKKHWAQRIAEAYALKEAPAYDILEEAVAALLEERRATHAALKDLGKMFGEMVIARRANNTERVFSVLDGVIASNVVEVDRPSANVH